MPAPASPQWILPKVANWDFLQKKPAEVKNRIPTDWKGTVVYINEEGRKINIAVDWIPTTILQLHGNANKLKNQQVGTILPPEFLNHLKAVTEHYAVEEAARLGCLGVRIMATLHAFTMGTGVSTEQPDPLHVTCHVKTAEWGQKKVHIYVDSWEKLVKPIASVVFVKDTKPLGAGNSSIDTNKFRAFWHPNLSYGLQPGWLTATTKSQENPEGKPSMQIVAKPTYQYIDERAKEFKGAVDMTKPGPLLGQSTNAPGGHMYTRFSNMVTKEFGTGKGQTMMMDYETGKWHQMVQDATTKKWSRAPSPPPPSGPKK